MAAADLADFGQRIDDPRRRGADRANDHEGQERARCCVLRQLGVKRVHVHAKVVVDRHGADRRGADQVARVLHDRHVGLGRDIERGPHLQGQRAVAPVLVSDLPPGLIGAECRVVGAAARVAVRQTVRQRDNHGGEVRLGATRGEVAGPALRIDAEGLHDQIDGQLLEGRGRGMLAPDRDVRAAAVGLVHGADRRRIRVDAEVAHVERAAHIGVVEVREVAKDLQESIDRDIASPGVEALAHAGIERLEGGASRVAGVCIMAVTPEQWGAARRGCPVAISKTTGEVLSLTFSVMQSI